MMHVCHIAPHRPGAPGFTPVQGPAVSRWAFTLVELLVVITIIVVLLALLVPALDKALYEAQLAVCSANLDGIGTGATIYAMDHSRRYPHRDHVHERNLQEPDNIALGGDQAANTDRYDDRRIIQNWISLKLLACPLQPCAVDLSDIATTEADTIVFSGYNLWFGYKYLPTGTGMLRVGQRIHWTETFASGQTRRQRFNVLAGDDDTIPIVNPGVNTTHPAKEGTLGELCLQNENFLEFAGGLGLIRQTTSRWWNAQALRRSTVDNNFAFQDGSAATFRDVVVQDDGDPDERMGRVPQWNDASNSPADWRIHMPAENR